MKFKYKELEKKSVQELQTILGQAREKMRDLRFKVASKQLKNIAEVGDTKTTIARIMFLLSKPVSKKQTETDKETKNQ